MTSGRAFTIRPATSEDLPAVGRLGGLLMREHHAYDADRFLPPGDDPEGGYAWFLGTQLAHEDVTVLVAEQDHRILGYAYAGPYHTRPGYRFTVEDSIYIAPSAQRQGIGEAMLARLIGTCEAMGLRQMIAIIGGSEPGGSVRLHSKLGFRQIGRIEASGFKHGKWLDTVLMQRAIGPGSTTLPER